MWTIARYLQILCPSHMYDTCTAGQIGFIPIGFNRDQQIQSLPPVKQDCTSVLSTCHATCLAGIGPITAALCVTELLQCRSHFTEFVYMGTAGASTQKGGVLNADNTVNPSKYVKTWRYVSFSGEVGKAFACLYSASHGLIDISVFNITPCLVCHPSHLR